MSSPPVHVNARIALTMVFAAFGGAVGALAGSIPAVSRAADIDSLTLGLGLTLSTFATVLAMSLGGIVSRHVTNRGVLLFALPAFAVLLALFLTSQSTAWFFIAFIPLGLLFGFTDIFMNTEGTALEHDLGRPVFTSFHGAVSLGVAVFAIMSSFVSTTIGTWATALLTTLGFAAAWVMVFKFTADRPPVIGRNASFLALPKRLPLAVLGMAAGLIIAGETAALLWSAKLLDELAPSLAAIAGLGAAFYALCNAVVRFSGDALRSRFGDLSLMTASLTVAIAGFATLGLSSSFAVSVAAFALVGFGTAVLVPCVIAVAAAYVPADRAGGLSFVSLITGLPRVLGPWAFGVVASGFGISTAFGLVTAAMTISLALIVVLRNLRSD